MMIEITHNREYQKIAKRLIKNRPEFEHIRRFNVKIAYASSWEEKRKRNKIVFGECRKVPDYFRWLIPYDFVIYVYEPNILHMNEKQLEILIYHELRHIGVKEDGVEPSFYIVPHDIEDFKNILERYGLEWAGG